MMKALKYSRFFERALFLFDTEGGEVVEGGIVALDDVVGQVGKASRKADEPDERITVLRFAQ